MAQSQLLVKASGLTFTNIETQATEYRYDALGRLQYVQYENGDIVRYSYDANGNMQTYKYQAEKREDSEDKKEENKPGSSDKKEENKPGSSDKGSGGNGGSGDNGGSEDSGESSDKKEEDKPGSSDKNEENNREDNKENIKEDNKEELTTDMGDKGDESSGIQREDSQPGRPVVAEKPVRKGDLFRTGTAVYQVTGVGKTKTVSLKRLTDKKAKSFKIPSTIKIRGEKYKVTKIASGAFQNRTKLTQVTIGSHVTGIGSKAFYGCKNLKKIKIASKKLKTVGVNAFRGIAKKASIRVPRSRYKTYKKILRGKGQAKSVRIIQNK